MPIQYPVTKTVISTSQWGIPITDAVNANTTAVANLQTATALTAWTAMTLINGFTNQNAGYNVAQYRKRGDMVEVRGTLTGGSYSTNFFQLPTGYRPPASIQIVARADVTSPYITVDSSGNMSYRAPSLSGANAGVFSILASFSTIA